MLKNEINIHEYNFVLVFLVSFIKIYLFSFSEFLFINTLSHCVTRLGSDVRRL